jgi:hypothetical protein
VGDSSVSAQGEEVQVDAGDALRVAVPEHRADESTPVAALRAEARVAELLHEFREALRNVLHAEAALSRLE